jgi:hypothetical protein
VRLAGAIIAQSMTIERLNPATMRPERVFADIA